MTIYLYGFVGPNAPTPPPALSGVAGAGVDLVSVGAVGAVVSSVPSDAFAPDAVERSVRDLDWVSEQGALHERVVTWFVDHGGILPVRLLTLYSGVPGLREAVEPRSQGLLAELERLEGLREWDLKVSYDADMLREHLAEVSDEVARLDEERRRAAPGRRYLLERKREQLLQGELSRCARALAAEALGRLATLASEVRRLPLPGTRAELPVVLNAALLLPREVEGDAAAAVERETERLGGLGLEVAFTGPWAPYRFAHPGPEGEGVDDGR